MNIKINQVTVYRDGGTVLIDTDFGKYWLPINGNRIMTGEIFGGDLETDDETHNYLVRAAFTYASRFFDIKRSVQ